VRTLTVETVDPRNEAALRDWYSVLEAAHPVDEPAAPRFEFAELRGGIPAANDPYERWHLLIALAGSEPVGSAKVEMAADNPHLGDFRLTVRPDKRRNGIGSALLAALESWALGAGCGVVISETAQWHGAPIVPGNSFAERHGYHRGQIAPRRELVLPSGRREFTVPGYSIRTWVDRCPEDLLAGRAELSRLFSADDPGMGEHRHSETWDAERIRAEEERSRVQDRTSLFAGAIAEDTGELVAFTVLGRARSISDHAYQLETVVAREHRGRRLASLVKLANLRAAAEAWPRVRRISAFNDSTNQPMIAINEALGFRVVATIVCWEKSF
jgi:RimJ/RimL family protein N-acetyltransferase